MQKKILIIDSQPMTARNIKIHMGKKYNVLWASTGKEGIALLGRENPDLLISELVLPDIEGMKIIEAISNNNLLVPIIITTQVQNPLKTGIGYKIGVMKVIKKPYNKDDLLSEISTILEHTKFSKTQESKLDAIIRECEKEIESKGENKNGTADKTK